MYPVEQAIRIALLEQTGLHEVAIASVIEAVRGLTNGVVINLTEVSYNAIHATYVAAFGPLDPNIMGNDVDWHINEIIRDAAPPATEPCAWIIEKVGHPVSMTHYRTVADSKRACGFTVTDHHSRVTK